MLTGWNGAEERTRSRGRELGVGTGIGIDLGGLCRQGPDHKPLVEVVVDAGGHLVGSARQDGATIARHDFAVAKAWSSIALGRDTRELARRAETSPAFFSAACTLFSSRLLPAPGGIVLRDGDIILGALGVSGNTGETDDACAEAAVRNVMALPA